MSDAAPPAESPPSPAVRWGAWAAAAVFAAILLLPKPDGMTEPGRRTLAVTAATGTLWFTGAVSFGAASLLPLVAFPLAGVLDAQEAAKAYMHRLVFLYLGGFLLALGLERWGVHQRLALLTVRVVGVGPRRVVLGMMLAVAGLSMWISNTAASIMMLPIALALLASFRELSGEGGGGAGRETRDQRREKGDAATDVVETSDHSSLASSLSSLTSPANSPTPLDRLTPALLLGIAYAASIGGIATPLGTPTNAAFIGIWSELFGADDAGRFSVARWIVAFGPVSAVLLGVAWVVLTWNLRPIPGLSAFGRQFFRDRLAALGPVRTPERRMLAVFGLAAVLWVVPGPLTAVLESAGVVPPGTLPAVDDSTIAVGCALLAFLLPAGVKDDTTRPRLLDWATAERLPWDILLLFGAGLTLAAAFEQTDLSGWIGGRLGAHLTGRPDWQLVLAVCLTVTFLTECTSNVATCTVLLPILAGVATTVGVEPSLLMLPAAASASCAFMLPIATPPNAIVFGSGRVSMARMARTGVVLNLLCVGLVAAGVMWWAGPRLGS